MYVVCLEEMVQEIVPYTASEQIYGSYTFPGNRQMTTSCRTYRMMVNYPSPKLIKEI